MSLLAARAYAQRPRGQRRRPTFGWESLTPTEQDVARLVAQGATNPEIARMLLMSVNTVKTHLAHTYTKLGIDSRAQLASLVVRHAC
jgi:DNA-binding CsgD family transcriptional regulator